MMERIGFAECNKRIAAVWAVILFMTLLVLRSGTLCLVCRENKDYRGNDAIMAKLLEEQDIYVENLKNAIADDLRYFGF